MLSISSQPHFSCYSIFELGRRKAERKRGKDSNLRESRARGEKRGWKGNRKRTQRVLAEAWHLVRGSTLEGEEHTMKVFVICWVSN